MSQSSIYIILVCGIPAIGKSFLSKKIFKFINEKENQNDMQIAYLSFDTIEKINEENFCDFQHMRDDYLKKFQSTINEIIKIKKKKNFIILDDNFYLKSMRKKFYQSTTENAKLHPDKQFYYNEIILRCEDISYAIKLNENRAEGRIPLNIIEKMNKEFEYSSSYAKNNNFFEFRVKDIHSFDSFSFEEYINSILSKGLIPKVEDSHIISIEKTENSNVVDALELALRKEIGGYLKKTKGKNGEKISLLKKSYIKQVNSMLSKDDLCSFKSNELKELIEPLKINNTTSKKEKMVNELTKYFVNNYLNEYQS